MDPRDANSASKEVTKVEMRAVFEVFAFCGKRTKADFKDWAKGWKLCPESLIIDTKTSL